MADVVDGIKIDGEREECYAQSLPVGSPLRTSHFRCVSFSPFLDEGKDFLTSLRYDQSTGVRGDIQTR